MTTLVEGDGVRTGATAIHPRGRSGAADPCAAGFHSFNGNGEMTGVAWIQESGTMSGPVCLTSTHAIGAAHQAVVRWSRAEAPDGSEGWLLPVVAETWDGYLNDASSERPNVADVLAALESASAGPVVEGSAGGGTGMSCYHFKGGSGTASRLVSYAGAVHTVGVFVQANFGSRAELTIAGVPVGRELLDDDPMAAAYSPASGAGSIIGVAVTDAPLLPNQCAALARRLPLGVARTGTSASHFSGDMFLGISVADAGAILASGLGAVKDAARPYSSMRYVPWAFMDTFFAAAVQATEEAIVNALVVNAEMVGYRGHRSPALPVDRVMAMLSSRGIV